VQVVQAVAVEEKKALKKIRPYQYPPNNVGDTLEVSSAVRPAGPVNIVALTPLLLFNLVSSLSISSLSTGLIAGGGGAGGGGGGVGIFGLKKLITLLYV
tara:strand:+ start:425 stop:721 length:297 start_codon:yes stop_codon:yes gene_type:complete